MSRIGKIAVPLAYALALTQGTTGYSSNLSKQAIFIHPFQDDNDWEQEESSTLSLVGEHSFSNSVIDFIKKKIDNRDIEIEQKVTNAALSLSDGDREVVELVFAKNGIPICLTQVKAINIRGKVAIFGDIPDLNASSSQSVDWPDYYKTVETSIAYTQELDSDGNTKIRNASRCFFPKDRELIPVWLLTLRAGARPFQVWADEMNVYKFAKLSFDLATRKGTFSTHLRDPVTNPDPQTFSEEVHGDGYMSNKFFRTDPSTNESEISRAFDLDGNFVYPPDDEFFPESSLFVHVNEHYAYFKKLGYKWSGPTSLTLKFHTLIGDTANNALYQPADGPQGSPSIEVGDGDAKILQNLALDSDVVSHEFGHHVIFRTITNTSGESLVLHEGLADFFVMSRNHDPCLGRSICVPGSTGCAVPGQCLRTADNNLIYQSQSYMNYEAHFKGQLVSGFLVDLWKFIDPKVVATMTFNSLSLMVSNSNIRNHLVALLLTDYSENQGKNSCAIYDAAIKRGFSSLLTDINCKKLDSLKTAAKNASPSPSSGKSSSSRSRNKSFLGCIGISNARPPASQDLSFFFVFVPYLIFGRRRSRDK